MYRPGDRFGPRTLPDYELVWITAGSATYHLKSKPIAAPTGSILLTCPGFRERYDWDPKRVSRHAYFHFDADAWPDDWPDAGDWPLLRVTGEGDVTCALFSHVLAIDGQRQDPTQPPGPELTRQVEALLSAFIHGASGRGDPASNARSGVPQAVRRGMDWATALLRATPDAKIDLDALAQAAAVTPKHLCRLFSNSVQRSPMQWVLEVRLGHARTLLRRSNLSVQAVGHRCGFGSPFHFSRAYKRHFGHPPKVDRTRTD